MLRTETKKNRMQRKLIKLAKVVNSLNSGYFDPNRFYLPCRGVLYPRQLISLRSQLRRNLHSGQPHHRFLPLHPLLLYPPLCRRIRSPYLKELEEMAERGSNGRVPRAAFPPPLFEDLLFFDPILTTLDLVPEEEDYLELSIDHSRQFR
eukprot:TRINITY_DN6576_c0_g1_i2.p2 TRINITY_DN6576_c0_g1~~TRINITY_DN6576_c0_g1_i2.p2  ORF type:complete len:149 (-),score=18.31 TRINITY_DN6576_c0_g1_i2:170-616(-)